MSGKRTVKSSRGTRGRSRGRADHRRLGSVSDQEIERTSPEELANLPSDFWDDAYLVAPVPKRAISLRVDRDVLAWFRSLGPRYQTRMNAVLRAYMTRMSSTTGKD